MDVNAATPAIAHAAPKDALLRWRDGIIRYTSSDGREPGRVDRFFDEVQGLQARLGLPGRLKFLVDARPLVDVPASSRARVYARAAEFRDHWFAVVGASAFQRFLIRFLVLATGSRHVRYFTDLGQAEAWLRTVRA